MNHLQAKSLAFYGVAIAVVVGLFSVVTAYGEANLKTAQSIEGDYRFKLPPLKDCPGSKPMTLSLQQSGIYIAAALVNPDLSRNQTAFKPMTLSGQLRQQQLTLSGQVPWAALCEKALGTVDVDIDGAITPPSNTLTGTISLDSATTAFTAQRQNLVP